MKTTQRIQHTDTAAIAALLEGQAIKSVTWGDEELAVLHLSDGTILTIIPNDGAVAGGDGEFFIEHVGNGGGNIITRAEFEEENGQEDVYRIFVYVEGLPTRENLLTVECLSSDWYGSGYEILVTR